MTIKIENRTERPLWLRLNSGQSLHLAPRQTSGELRDVEVKSNAKVQKLREQHVIVLHEEGKKPQQGSSQSTKTGAVKAEQEDK